MKRIVYFLLSTLLSLNILHASDTINNESDTEYYSAEEEEEEDIEQVQQVKKVKKVKEEEEEDFFSVELEASNEWSYYPKLRFLDQNGFFILDDNNNYLYEKNLPEEYQTLNGNNPISLNVIDLDLKPEHLKYLSKIYDLLCNDNIKATDQNGLIIIQPFKIITLPQILETSIGMTNALQKFNSKIIELEQKLKSSYQNHLTNNQPSIGNTLWVNLKATFSQLKYPETIENFTKKRIILIGSQLEKL